MAGLTSIRAGSGLGDSLYLQGVVRLLVERGRRDLEALTKYPELFLPLAGRVKVGRFRRQADILAHYTRRRGVPDSNQWQDCCIAAGIREAAPLRLDWTPRSPRLVERLREAAAGRPIVLVAMPREPMARGDNFALELLPDCRRLQQAVDLVGRRALTVQVGRGPALFRLERLGLDLANATSVAELADAAAVAAGGLGYCSFLVPLMESFDRALLAVWSRRGLESRTELIRRLTPAKVMQLPRRGAAAVMDDCPDPELEAAVGAFLDACRDQAPV